MKKPSRRFDTPHGEFSTRHELAAAGDFGVDLPVAASLLLQCFMPLAPPRKAMTSFANRN
jgi:hypothetical protein